MKMTNRSVVYDASGKVIVEQKLSGDGVRGEG